MQVGNLVKHALTEQIGIVMTTVADRPDIAVFSSVRVMWTTQGDSLFGPGHKEWCNPRSLDLLTTA